MTADGGGRKGRRHRLWTVALPPLAHGIDLRMALCHCPPGTSQWHQIAPRMVSHLRRYGRGRPLSSHEVTVHQMAHTTTQHGRTIHAALETGRYRIGIKVTDHEVEQVKLKQSTFHGEWHDTIMPMRSSK